MHSRGSTSSAWRISVRRTSREHLPPCFFTWTHVREDPASLTIELVQRQWQQAPVLWRPGNGDSPVSLLALHRLLLALLRGRLDHRHRRLHFLDEDTDSPERATHWKALRLDKRKGPGQR